MIEFKIWIKLIEHQLLVGPTCIYYALAQWLCVVVIFFVLFRVFPLFFFFFFLLLLPPSSPSTSFSRYPVPFPWWHLRAPGTQYLPQVPQRNYIYLHGFAYIRLMILSQIFCFRCSTGPGIVSGWWISYGQGSLIGFSQGHRSSVCTLQNPTKPQPSPPPPIVPRHTSMHYFA